MEIRRFSIGDVVRMRKPHPCGSREWVVTRVGADIKIRCQGCGRMVMMPRSQFERGVLEILPPNTG